MSLQELSGSIVHLKLSVREGHGFGFLKKPIVIVAGTNGIFLETEIVPPSPDPLFHIDLVWETDKRNLRKFRASNTPMKIECFTIGSNNHRECIGSILLNIKSAQVILSGSVKPASEKWHRLIGVPLEAKALQPELLLSLTIQEPSSLSQSLPSNILERRQVENVTSGEKPSGSVNKISNPLLMKTLIPEQKQGYIQLGPENSCSDSFLLSICVKRGLEMELLLRTSSDSINTDDSKPYCISFTFMEQTKSIRPSRDITRNKIWHVDEDLVYPLRTSLSNLHSYLQENPCATICLFRSGKEIAASELHIRSLVPTNEVQIFSREFNGETTLTQNCILVSTLSGSVRVEGHLQPIIEVTSKLSLAVSKSSKRTLPVLNQLKNPHDTNPLQNKSIGCQALASEDSSSRSESRQSQDTFIVATQIGPAWVPVAPDVVQSDINKRKEISESPKERSLIKTVFFKVVPNLIRFYEALKYPWVRILFDCPGACVNTSKYEDTFVGYSFDPISLENICARITAMCGNTIQIHVLGIEEGSTFGQHLATAKIDTKALDLTAMKKTNVSCELRGSVSEQILGCILATVSLEECTEEIFLEKGFEKIVSEGPQHQCNGDGAECVLSDPFSNEKDLRVFSDVQSKSCSKDMVHSAPKLNIVCHKVELSPQLPSVPNHLSHPQDKLTASRSGAQTVSTLPLDCGMAYRIVEELEDWKEKQQEIFLAELKQKEMEHLARIADEWTAQTKAKNADLDNNVAECKMLAESLSSTKQDLRDRLTVCAKREQELLKAKDDLDRQYNLKFQELTLAAQRLDDDVKLKISSAESKCLKLEERIKELECENKTLQHQVKQETFGSQTCGMTHNQVSQLLAQVDQLEGKLKASLQSKAYFKEQWGRAVREMNQAKIQYAQTSGSSKCLETLLGQEEKALQHDQKTLEKLRQEISHLN